MIYIGADHRGYKLKEEVARWLFENKYKFSDMGATHLDPDDDYPLIAQKVGSLTAGNPGDLGILLCGSGVGVEVVANKIDGVRAGIGKDIEQVKAARGHDNMNILVLAADYTGVDQAKKMVETFLTTPFSGKSRYVRRIKEIERIEKNN